MIMALFSQLVGFVGGYVGKKFAKPITIALLVLAAIAVLFAIKAAYDASVVDDYENDRAIESIEARDDAATARANDAINNAQNEKELNDAIDAAPKGGELSPAARALACERLRRRGGELPAACRSGSGDGSETGTD